MNPNAHYTEQESMNAEIFIVPWKQVLAEFRQWWGALTEDELQLAPEPVRVPVSLRRTRRARQ